jgi:hypothetical protein
VLVGSYIKSLGPHRFTHHLCLDPAETRLETGPGQRPSAGLFSVALVVGLPRLAVSQSAALRCSDFPLAPLRRPATA